MEYRVPTLANRINFYSVIKEIASHFDLNSLDALSSTCRQVRANLLQYRNQLIQSTLHCENENIKFVQECSYRSPFIASGHLSISAGARKCARDFVGPCQRCSRVVCRVSLLFENKEVRDAHQNVELRDETSSTSSSALPPPSDVQNMLQHGTH